MLGYCANIYTSLTITDYKGGKNKMTNLQRMRSDMVTIDRREIEDDAVRENRRKNDELTGERRFKADRAIQKDRLRNDELTINRRETKDGTLGMTLAIFFTVLIVLTVGTLYVLV
jgi:hypothetical protein